MSDSLLKSSIRIIWTADALWNLHAENKWKNNSEVTQHPLVTAAPCTYLPLAACLAVILSSSFLPIWRSCLPSMEPVCTAFSWSQNVIWPFKAATASSLPSGRKATTRTAKNLVTIKNALRCLFKIPSYFSKILAIRKSLTVKSITVHFPVQMFS